MLGLKIAKRKHRESGTCYLEESAYDIPQEDAQDHEFVCDDRIQKMFGLSEIKKMRISVQRSIVESFNFNGKHVRFVYVKDVGQCFVSKDVYEVIGYEKEDRVKAIQQLVPKQYKI